MPAIIINPRRSTIARTKISQSSVSFVAAARNVAVGQSWAFRDHRSMQQVMADERAARRRAVIACNQPDCAGPSVP